MVGRSSSMVRPTSLGIAVASFAQGGTGFDTAS